MLFKFFMNKKGGKCFLKRALQCKKAHMTVSRMHASKNTSYHEKNQGTQKCYISKRGRRFRKIKIEKILM